MVAQLTFGQEVWLAVIQGVGVLVGVIGGLWVGSRQARKGWEHQLDAIKEQNENERKMERVKAMRGERIALYRRLTTTCGAALDLSIARPWPLDAHERRYEAKVAWERAHSEARLIGSPEVIDAALEIDTLMSARSAMRDEHAWQELGDMFDKFREAEARGETLPPEGPALLRLPSQAEVDQINEQEAQNRAHLGTLITACRADIAEPRF